MSFSGFFQEAHKLGEMANDPFEYAKTHKKEMSLDDFVQLDKTNLLQVEDGF